MRVPCKSGVMVAYCIACGGTGVNSRGAACAACIMNCRQCMPKVIIPNGSLVKAGERWGIVMGREGEGYNVAIVVDGKARSIEVLEEDEFNVVKRANNEK